MKKVLFIFLALMSWAGCFMFVGVAKAQDIIISEDTVWEKGEVRVIDGDEGVLIMPDITLTIKEGVIVKLAPENSIHIQGKLLVEGTKDERVILTSIKDDEAGGDTNGDGNATEPAPEDWGIIITNDDNAEISASYLDVKYAGGISGLPYFLSVANANTVEIEKSNILNNYGAILGVGFNGFSIHNSNIYNPDFCEDGFCGSGLVNLSDSVINAENNYWGHTDGPTIDPSEIKGTFIQGNVAYEPFLIDFFQEEDELDPVILIPGFLGSWENIFSGRLELDPISHVYDDLWEALKNSGYVEDNNLFAFPYNWRDSNATSSLLLKEKIDEIKNICGCDKVDLVAHSMGGIVARAYIQGNDYGNDVDQMIFIATPHRGSPKAYLGWEGGESGIKIGDFLVENILYAEAEDNAYFSIYEYTRNRPILSIKELLPIYDYLRDKGEDNYRVYPDNYPVNQFLEDLNSNDSLAGLDTINITNIIAGAGAESTIRGFRVIDGDFPSGQWEHGYPEGYRNHFTDRGLEMGAGDETVPLISNEDFYNSSEIFINGSDHASIVADSQKDIIEVLTGQRPEDEIKNNIFKKFFIIRIFSPADFVIISPSGKRLGKDFSLNIPVNEIDKALYSGFESGPEFAVIPNPEDGEYIIELIGTDDGGDYILSASYIDEDKDLENNFQASIYPGAEQTFGISLDSSSENPIGSLLPNDDIKPTVNIISPASSQEFLRSQILNIEYEAFDDFSGIATTSIMIDGEIADVAGIDLFDYSLGGHVIQVEAVDKACNIGTSSVSFEIVADIDSMISDIIRLHNKGSIERIIDKIFLIARLEFLKFRLAFLDMIKCLEKHRDEVIVRTLNRIERKIDRMEEEGRIDGRGHGILMEDIEYLRNNL